MPDVAQPFETVSPRSGHGRRFADRHLKPGEHLVAAEHAYIGKLMGKGDERQQNGELLVTTERVAFYRKRLFGGEILRSIPLASISGVDRQSNAMWSWLEIRASNITLAVGFPRKGDDRILDAIERLRAMKRAA